MNKNCPHCKKEIEITPQDAARVMGEIRSEKKTLSSRDNGKKKKRRTIRMKNKEQWTWEYDNDVGPRDDSFRKFWNIYCDIFPVYCGCYT